MPPVIRKNDKCSGHSCWPPRLPTTWSPNVFINNNNSIRVDDKWSIHCCTPGTPCHDGTQISGSPNVFVNGRKKARRGDLIDCGSKNANGSPNVFANGG